MWRALLWYLLGMLSGILVMIVYASQALRTKDTERRSWR